MALFLCVCGSGGSVHLCRVELVTKYRRREREKKGEERLRTFLCLLGLSSCSCHPWFLRTVRVSSEIPLGTLGTSSIQGQLRTHALGLIRYYAGCQTLRPTRPPSKNMLTRPCFLPSTVLLNMILITYLFKLLH